MTSSSGAGEPPIASRALRTPESAALAGIAFSILFTITLVFSRLAVAAAPSAAGQWLSDSTRRRAGLIALKLVPFAGIAFLWFIGVVRDRIGEAEDRFFATVFFGSGTLLVAMLLASTATAAGLVASAGRDSQSLLASGAWRTGRQVSHELLNFAMRMAAVFTIAASTILRRTRTGPQWLATSGYAVGVVLLVAVDFYGWLELLFPAWVLILSLHILVTAVKPGDAAPTE